jgi:WD40 repeat protein
MARLPGKHAEVVSRAAFHPLRNQLAIVQGDSSGTSLLGPLLGRQSSGLVVTLVDPITGKQERLLQGHQDGARLVSYADKAERLISGGRDGLAIVWDLNTGNKLTQVKHSSRVTGIALSADGNLAASTSEPEQMTKARFGQGSFPTEAE